MKKCNDCGAENPEDAKFCRGCGKIFQVIPSIKWIETSLVKTWSFVGWSFVMLLLFIGIFYPTGGLIAICTPASERDIPILIFFWIYSIIFIIICCRICSKYKQTQKFRRIASAIENTDARDRLISKAGKLGLYDWRKKKVLLGIEYDSIKKQNDFYYVVNKGNKYGMFSRLSNSFIVPCEYDSVSPFVNNVATIIKGNITEQVDTQGNIF
jgi:hypothetical protein